MNKIDFSSIWYWLVLALVVGGAFTYAAFPQETINTVTETEYIDVPATVLTYADSEYSIEDVLHLEANISTLEADATQAAKDLEALEAELAESKDTLNFEAFFNNALEHAEDEGEVDFEDEIYEGDDGEFDIDFGDLDADQCSFEGTDDDDWSDGLVTCSNVELETDDDDDVVCDIEVELKNGKFDDVDIDDCEED